MKRFKHSGTLGDIVYALPLMKQMGGGEFYLHLNQIDWIGQHYYGSEPNPFHQGRMTEQDLEFMRPLFEKQRYISKFAAVDKNTEITHNLDRFRPLFVNHPGNYVDIYCQAFGINDFVQRTAIRTSPWLEVPIPKLISGKTHVINRTSRWLPPELNPIWNTWRDSGLDQQSIFIGLPQEYEDFVKTTGWTATDYYPTKNMLEMAEVIAGCNEFIGNQSVALSIAIGLGIPFLCEARRDLPLLRNECYFPNQYMGRYF